MEILVLILLALVAILLLMAILGSFYNKKYVIICCANFNSDKDKIWKAITNPMQEEIWRNDLKKIELGVNDIGQPLQTEINKHGKKRYFIVESDKQNFTQKRIIANQKSFSGFWQIKIDNENNLTRVEITETAEIYNTVLRFIYHTFLIKKPTAAVYLKMLANYLNEPAVNISLMPVKTNA